MRKRMPQGVSFFAICLVCFLLTGMGARPPIVGSPAPVFTLNDLEGRAVSLGDYQGKSVLLTFWASWCGPCKQEMPEIQEAYEQHKDHGFVVLAVNFGEKPDPAASFAHHGRLTFPILLDPGVKVASRYGVVSLPVSFFIDSNGIIQERIFGGTLTVKSISNILKHFHAE